MDRNENSDKYLLVHLGRRNAGPRILAEVAKSLSKEGKLNGIIFSKYVDNIEELDKIQTELFPVRTYKNKFTFVLSLLELPLNIRRVDRILGKFYGTNVMFVMHHIWDPFILYLIHKRKKNRIIYWVHDAQNHVGESQTINKILVTSALRFADVIVTLSTYVSQKLNFRNKDLSIVQISHPVILDEEIEISLEKSTLQVLFLGRISKYKGLERLAAAWPIVLKNIPTANLVIAGDGEHQRLKNLFNNLTNCSTIFKYLNDAEIYKLMRSSALIVLPYDGASQSGILVKAVEHAIPYIATPVGGLIEQNLELGGGLIVEDLSPKTFALGIIEVLNDLSKYKATSISTNLSFDSQIKSLDGQLRELFDS
jgi:glycosyltransferase involved in cell wall biosynthesis